MAPFKLLIFDLSGVCLSNEDDPFVDWFVKEHPFERVEFERSYNDLIFRAERGEMNAHEMFMRLKEQFETPLSPDELIAQVMTFKTADEKMLALVAKLRKHYKTAYLTNVCREYWEWISTHFDLSPYFDYGLASYQVGERKPHQKGFEMLLSKFSVAPSEAVFIDDSEGNLAIPAEMGIATIHFTDAATFPEKLSTIGIRLS